MSRRCHSRERKYFDPSASGPAMVGIGRLPPLAAPPRTTAERVAARAETAESRALRELRAAVASLDEEARVVAARALAAMVALHDRHGDLWRGDEASSGRGATTGDIAAFLRVVPDSPERTAIGEGLTAMRKRGIVHYEHAPGPGAPPLRWWLTEEGLAAARAVSSGSEGDRR